MVHVARYYRYLSLDIIGTYRWILSVHVARYYRYLSVDIFTAIQLGRMRLVECGRHGEKINTYRVFVGRSEGERMLERRIPKWDDDIKMDVKETKWEDLD